MAELNNLLVKGSARVLCDILSNGSITGDTVWGAVWNDLADFITIPDGDIVEPGYCYAMTKDGHYEKTSKYAQKNYIALESDTFGFGMGNDDTKNKLHATVAGYVLAYVDKEYECGTPLTCTKEGFLTKANKLTKLLYPELIIATFWKGEESEEWGSSKRKVKVNGRHWVKIK